MYVDREPWHIWKDNGGLKLRISWRKRHLTCLQNCKKESAKGSQNKRKVGSGASLRRDSSGMRVTGAGSTISG